VSDPDGRAMPAELTLRGHDRHVRPEIPQMAFRGAKTLDGSLTTWYLLTENADQTVGKTAKPGAVAEGPVMN
jgi:hypothetical protein